MRSLLSVIATDAGLAVAIAAALRICFALVGLAAIHSGSRAGAVHGDWEALVLPGRDVWSELLSTWQRWDALWYQHIATDGYSSNDGSTAFLPLYPFLAHLVSTALGGHVVVAELLISSAAFVIAMWLLARLTRLDIGDPVASPRVGRIPALTAPVLAVLLTALFPVGFFLLAPYTEALYLALSVGAFYLARTGRPWSAGVIGSAAALARPPGVLIALPLAYEYLRSRDSLRWIARRGGRAPGFALVASALPIVAFAALLLLEHAFVGASIEAQSLWGAKAVLPWDGLAASWKDILVGGAHGNAPEIEALNLVTLLGFVALAILCIKRLPAAYAIYAGASMMVLATREAGFSPLMSVSRLALVVFPCFVVLALLLVRRPALAWAWLAISALLELILFQYWVRWGFVA